ncbi:26S proteasome non-ATPase regulatory subunit 5 isoform X1 [Bombyx mori]|uniref:26S proteasome non-ATPase regulatory subunit 5 n=1 Tax=Bombyx mori TaxID=7091 RepID=A0A8R2APU6_BOMMO|nr:26S proteasome non-ATPase regulatory subunit 5 [Bombyx mori]
MDAEVAEQLRDLITRLQTDEDIPSAMNQLKTLLVSAPTEISETILEVGLSKILQCFNIFDRHLVDLICEVLTLCFEKFSPGEVIKSFTGNFMYLLRHENAHVRRLAVDEIAKAVISSSNALPIPQYIDVYVAVGQLVGDNDIGVANKAILITSNLPEEAYTKVLEEMKILLKCSSSSKCNVFEVIINISIKSYDLFKICLELGYIDIMVQEIQSLDVLYQLNILELMSTLAIKPYGINYLLNSGAMDKLVTVVIDLKTSPVGGILIPGYMKLFGCIAHYFPKEIIEKYPILLNFLFGLFESGKQAVLPVALDTFGFVGSTTEGKLSLVASGGKFTETMMKVNLLIKNSSSDIKIRALNCLTNLISIEKDTNTANSKPVDHRVTLITREWFRGLSEQPSSMDLLFDICKNPFPDIRLAAFGLLDAVSQHQWGHELIARTAGFIEYLLDRSVDFTKECKEAKYDIIKRLSNSEVFDSNITSRLQAYVEEGPFYCNRMLEVAMEDAD